MPITIAFDENPSFIEQPGAPPRSIAAMSHRGRSHRFVLAVGAMLAVMLALAPVSSAQHVPRAKLVKDADLVCSYENGRLAQFKQADLPDTSIAPSKASPAQIKEYTKYLAWIQKILADRITRVFALGTPSEPAARVAWARWKVLETTVALPGYRAGLTAAKAGDGKALAAAFAKIERYNGEAKRLTRTIGFQVCGWES